MERKIKILLIGNLNKNKPSVCGQRTKVLLYKNILLKEGYNVVDCDLSIYKNNLFSLFFKIKKEIKKCDIVVALPGSRCVHLILPFINILNKKLNKRIVYSSIGVGLLSYYLKKKDSKDIFDFYKTKREIEKCNVFDSKSLKGVNASLFETELLRKTHEIFYRANNCLLMENFRDTDFEMKEINKNEYPKKQLRLVFLSRIVREKGIFDLLEVINKLNKEYNNIFLLDIYGDSSILNENDKKIFDSFLSGNISYKGSLVNSEVILKISEYDLFCFTSRFFDEGTPGVLAESLIAGTPILTSHFFQVDYILKDGYDSIFYKQYDVNDLEGKLLYIYEHQDILYKLKEGIKESRKRFIYKNQREYFLKIINGE